MASKKIKTQYPGVRYYEHATRKFRGGQADRYFSIRHRVDGKATEEGLGWATEGWSAEKAHNVLSKLRESTRLGHGARTVAEMRAKGDEERRAQIAAAHYKELSEVGLANFFDDYCLPRFKLEKRTWLTDKQRFDKAIRISLGSLPLKAITRENVQEFLDGLERDGAAPATIKHYMAIIRRTYNIAAETLINGKPMFTGLNPTTGLRLPAIHNSRERFLSGEEANILIKAAESLRSPDLGHAIVLSLNTGLRLGELQRLSWHDVDFVAQFLTVRDEAQRKPGGKIPLNEAAITILKSRSKDANIIDLVFPPIYGQNFRENMSAEFRRLVDTLGFNKGLAGNDRRRRVVFHTLRHTFASWLALAGVDIYRIKTLMRHKTLAMTMRYAHLIPDATRDAVHKLTPPK